MAKVNPTGLNLERRYLFLSQESRLQAERKVVDYRANFNGIKEDCSR
jgi:hypothetical protein